MWITYPLTHILLKVSLSGTFLKTMKLSSKWLSKGEVQRWDVSRTHRVALDWLFDRILLEPKTQIRYVDARNQLADVLTKGSFSRGEWNHHFCLFNIMSFSMFSCSHFSDFLSDPIRKQSAMSKRGQEATSGEGSPMAKPKPMVPAKARPLNLVARNPWSEKNSSQNLSIWSIPRNVDERKGVEMACETVCKPLQSQKSEILKWVDKKML